MDTAHANVRDLARRLIDLEAARDRGGDRHVDGVVRVCENLRTLMSKLVGIAGFRSLLSRALALTRVEADSLGDVRIGEGGSLEGFEGVDPGAAGEIGVVLVAQLLGLLVTFIGPSLTLRLVRDGWPDASWDGIDLSTGGTT